MADTLYSLPISSLTSKKPESSDKFISYDDTEKQAHVTTAGDLAETLNENISDAFSSGNSYSAGDYCIYNDTLYKFTADHSGAWDNDDVEAVTVGGELNELNTNTVYHKGDVINIASYRCGGFVTSSNSSVQFSVPIKAVGDDVTGATANLVMVIRQNGNYTHGSSNGVSPSSIDNIVLRDGFITFVCTMASTTNATNNDACGIQLNNGSTITLT